MNETTSTSALESLTSRQRQILALIQAGKVNKEVARELGIEVGTVKQHMVAIFKKLNVTNRTMAVAKYQDLTQSPVDTPTSTAEVARHHMERRPCLVLALQLPESLSERIRNRFMAMISAKASAAHAIFLTRRNHGCEVIFGVHRISERDVLQAITLAIQAADYLREQVPDHGLSAALAAGMALASLDRFGDWTEEVIASPVIAKARHHLPAPAQAGLWVCQQSQQALALLGVSVVPHNPQGRHDWSSLQLDACPPVDDLDWVGQPLVLESLKFALEQLRQGQGGLLWLQGAAGMGKSRLLRYCQQQGVSSVLWRAWPEQTSDTLLVCPSSEALATKQALTDALGAFPSGRLLLVDDVHLLSKTQRHHLLQAARLVAQQGVLVILASCQRLGEDIQDVRELTLSPMNDDDLYQLMQTQAQRQGQVLTADTLHSYLALCAGNPLHARELVRAAQVSGLPWSVLVLVLSRLQTFKLDHCLLYTLVSHEKPTAMDSLADSLSDDPSYLRDALERAMQAGVVDTDEQGRVFIRNPLFVAVMKHVMLHHLSLLDL